MLGTLNKTEIEVVLHEQIIGRIGCHADNMTFVVPISYAYDGKYIYGHSKEGLKISLMRKNPQVCFEVDIIKDMANWKTVITWGDFEELLDPKDRHEALKILVERILPLVSSETTHLYTLWPFPSDIDEIKGIIFRIRLHEKSGRFETNSASPAQTG